ncbi:MAG: DUF1697 domain-containing protein [Thermoplasmata archaeon]|nr:DUF1697 domain-containing protein [Thermoplasmata archaeon]
MTATDRAYVALLRAVNVGGTVLKMERLRRAAEGLGLSDVRTLLQSGNLVFRSRASDPARLEEELQRTIAASEGLATDVFVRPAREWREVLLGNPFPQEAVDDPGRLVVTALKGPPPPSAWTELHAAIPGRERVQGIGRHAYIVYPDGQGRSKLTIALIERKLGTRGTSRNWNTVRKLEAAASE